MYKAICLNKLFSSLSHTNTHTHTDKHTQLYLSADMVYHRPIVCLWLSNPLMFYFCHALTFEIIACPSDTCSFLQHQRAMQTYLPHSQHVLNRAVHANLCWRYSCSVHTLSAGQKNMGLFDTKKGRKCGQIVSCFIEKKTKTRNMQTKGLKYERQDEL